VEQIIQHQLSLDGMVSVKLVSDKPVAEARMLRCVHGPTLDYAQVKCYSTTALSLFYGEVTFPMRGAVEVHCDGWKKMRRLACWRLMKEDGFSVSQVIEFLVNWYFVQTHRMPNYAFIRKLPKPAFSGQLLAGDVMLMEAEWALEKCVMVGG